MLRVNPPTAYLMLHHFTPPQASHWVIQNAANSGVGHCLIKLAREEGMKRTLAVILVGCSFVVLMVVKGVLHRDQEVNGN